MAQPYIGEIRMLGCNFAPVNWAFCDGSLQSIAQNSTLFNLIGTTYGGDGVNTFALPDLRGRMPMHQGNGFVISQKAGEESVLLTSAQIPSHTHAPLASTAAGGNPDNSPANNYWSGWTGGQFTAPAPNASLNPAAVGQAGGSLPHDNMPPYQVVNFVIALYGIYPSQA